MQARPFDRTFVMGHIIGILAVILCTAVPIKTQAQEQNDAQREIAKTEAVILWVGLTILAVLIVGLGLIWGASRWAKRIHRMRPPVHTEMKNIWYTNPPEKRKQGDRE